MAKTTISGSTLSFPFLRLPREIRDKVYVEALRVWQDEPKDLVRLDLNPYKISIQCCAHRTTMWRKAEIISSPQVCRVSRQLGREGNAILYGRNVFRVLHAHDMNCFFLQIGKANRAHVRWVELAIDEDITKELLYQQQWAQALRTTGLRLRHLAIWGRLCGPGQLDESLVEAIKFVMDDKEHRQNLFVELRYFRSEERKKLPLNWRVEMEEPWETC
ncbi:hypothetical protein MMC12_005561 [Toensbergia leucococca]|nr:hypothetical protein [Toensbergia leucococca]